MAHSMQLVTIEEGTPRFRRVRPRRTSPPGQLNLWGAAGRVVPLDRGDDDPFRRALALDMTGRPEAAEAYRQAAAADEGYAADALCNLGLLSVHAEDYDGAFRAFAEALVQDPAHVATHYNVGCLHLHLGQFVSARLHLHVAVGLSDDDGAADAVYNLALACAVCGDGEGADAALVRYAEAASSSEAEAARSLVSRLLAQQAAAGGAAEPPAGSA
ncbi:MAG: hypothetical protein R3181_00215 [Rubricoccaceae bacterium]|nr:hypothetical protein [Rubricoccaceae bacterium]